MQYINVQPFMIRDLHLSGNTLLVYAAIHGFSTHQKCFYGSFQYLADMICTTVDEIKSIIDTLVSDGLLLKKESTWKGTVHQMYQTAKKAIAHIKDSIAPQKTEPVPQKDRSNERTDTPAKPMAYGHFHKRTVSNENPQGASMPTSKETYLATQGCPSSKDRTSKKESVRPCVNTAKIDSITDISKEPTLKDYDEEATEKLKKQFLGRLGLLPRQESDGVSAPKPLTVCLV